jgi:hypothetical protein
MCEIGEGEMNEPSSREMRKTTQLSFWLREEKTTNNRHGLIYFSLFGCELDSSDTLPMRRQHLFS